MDPSRFFQLGYEAGAFHPDNFDRALGPSRWEDQTWRRRKEHREKQYGVHSGEPEKAGRLLDKEAGERGRDLRRRWRKGVDWVGSCRWWIG